MSKTLYWLQCGSCGGDSMSLLSTNSPNLIQLLQLLDVEPLWHPSLSARSASYHRSLVRALLNGERPLDILCLEGAVIRGPGGSGMFDLFDGSPKKDLVAGLASRAHFVIAIGTCASFGGIGAGMETEATGAQFLKRQKGGFLGEGFRTASGLPVINLPGCPCNGEIVAGALTALCAGTALPLTEFNSPLEWYDMLVHQGCVRNEYHEYRVEDKDFGGPACLFFHMGCRGPLAHGACNKILWNGRSSKTRVGVPCFGCTEPDFPQERAFFQTPNIVDIPLELPNGVDRAHYIAYKGMAAAAAPARLRKRETRI